MKTSPRLGVCSILCVLVTIAVSTACRSVRREAELARAKQEYLDSVRLGAKPQVPAVDPREAPPAIRGRARFVQSGRSEVDVIVPTITTDGIVDEVEGWRAALEIGQLPPATGLAQPMTFRLGYSGYEASKESVDYDLEKHDRIWTAVHVTYYDGTDRWYQRSWFLENQLGDRFVELKLANDLGKPALRLVRDDLQVLEPNTPAVYQRPNTNVGDPNSDSVAIRGRARFRSKTSNRSATGTLEGVAPVQQKPVTSASAVLYFSESTGRVPEPRTARSQCRPARRIRVTRAAPGVAAFRDRRDDGLGRGPLLLWRRDLELLRRPVESPDAGRRRGGGAVRQRVDVADGRLRHAH